MKSALPKLLSLPLLTLPIIPFVLSIISTPAVSAVIFEDDFDRSNTSIVGLDWNEGEKDSNDVAIYQNQLRLRDHQNGIGASISRIFDPQAASGLSIAFDWRASNNTENSDFFYLSTNLSREPDNAIWQTQLGGSDYAHTVINFSDLPLTGSGPISTLFFWIDVGSAGETVYIDNLMIAQALTFDDTPTIPEVTVPSVNVPEPGTTGLLASGLLGLSFRQKAKFSSPNLIKKLKGLRRYLS